MFSFTWVCNCRNLAFFWQRSGFLIAYNYTMMIIILLLLLLILIGITFCNGRVDGSIISMVTTQWRQGDWHLVHLHSIDLNRFFKECLFDVFLSVRFGHVQCFEEHWLASCVLRWSKPQYESDNNVFYTKK